MPGLQRYDIFESKFHALTENMLGKKYKAIAHEKIIQGIIEPRYSAEIKPDQVGQVEAMNSREAVAKFVAHHDPMFYG